MRVSSDSHSKHISYLAAQAGVGGGQAEVLEKQNSAMWLSLLSCLLTIDGIFLSGGKKISKIQSASFGVKVEMTWELQILFPGTSVGHWWLTPVILAEMGRSWLKSRPGKKFSRFHLNQ
jgi:hypothetical protein